MDIFLGRSKQQYFTDHREKLSVCGIVCTLSLVLGLNVLKASISSSLINQTFATEPYEVSLAMWRQKELRSALSGAMHWTNPKAKCSFVRVGQLWKSMHDVNSWCRHFDEGKFNVMAGLIRVDSEKLRFCRLNVTLALSDNVRSCQIWLICSYGTYWTITKCPK